MLDIDGYEVVITMCDRTKEDSISGEVIYRGEYITIPRFECSKYMKSDEAIVEQLTYILDERELEKQIAASEQ